MLTPPRCSDAGPAVEARDLSYVFGTGSVSRAVLSGVSLTLDRGEVVMLTGPSGSGKTTLMTLIGALRALQDGSCRVLGHELRGATESQRIMLRRSIGFIFQEHRLLRFLTSAQNVALALETDPYCNEQDRRMRATAMLEKVGLKDFINAFPDDLSGGQRQRVAIARALVRMPGLILADEPTASLDGYSGGEATRLLCDLARQTQAGVLIVTHDNRIMGVADRVLKLEDGSILS